MYVRNERRKGDDKVQVGSFPRFFEVEHGEMQSVFMKPIVYFFAYIPHSCTVSLDLPAPAM